MTSAYGGSPGTGTLGISALAYLPLVTVLSSRRVAVGAIRKEEWEPCRVMMNVIIDEGLSWPFLQEYDTMDAFCGYFLSHAAFVVRAEEAGVDSDGNPSQKGDLLGMFYVKPNFPGRCAHVCNGGFITFPRFRRQGVGRLMGSCFLKFAKDLGYKASYFNLVFASNPESLALWESLGLSRVAHIPRCAEIKGFDDLVDAYGYRQDLEALPSDFDPLAFAARRPSKVWVRARNLHRLYVAVAPTLLPVSLVLLFLAIRRS